MLTNEFFKLNTNTNLCNVKTTVKRNHPMLLAGNPGKSRNVCDHPALFLNDNHAMLKCLLASYSTVVLSAPRPGLYIYLTTLLTSPIEFSLYFQHYVRYLNENFRDVRKIYETGLRSKIMQVNHFIKYLRYLNTASLIFKRRKK